MESHGLKSYLSVGTVPTSKTEVLGDVFEVNETVDVCVAGNVTGELWATGLGGVTVKLAMLGKSFDIGVGGRATVVGMIW